MHGLSGLQRDIVFVIEGLDGPKGLAVKERLDEYYDTAINHGRLYPNLDSLVERGIVEKGSIDDRTNSYSLTDRGRRELEARREWEKRYRGRAARRTGYGMRRTLDNQSRRTRLGVDRSHRTDNARISDHYPRDRSRPSAPRRTRRGETLSSQTARESCVDELVSIYRRAGHDAICAVRSLDGRGVSGVDRRKPNRWVMSFVEFVTS